MSGFSGIMVFDDNLFGILNSFKFPYDLNGFYHKCHQTVGENFKVISYNNNKFENDSFLVQQQDQIIGFEGILLEPDSKINQVKSLNEFLEIAETTRGTFSAIYRNHATNDFVLMADHTGSCQVFYYWCPAFFAFSSSILLLTRILKHFNVSTSLSSPSSYMMISLGYLLEDFTLVSEIKKIRAGHYIQVTNQQVMVKRYHNYYREVTYNHMTKDLLAELDQRFKKSLTLEYEKDKTYNFNHLATLSGGLDSRLNVMLANEYGYNDITCLTFSDGFKSDELTARRISADLSLKHIILLLNSGFQLYDLETPLILNNCSVYYFGAAHTLAAVQRVNFSRFGLLHNGGLAESSKGGYLSDHEHREPRLAKRYAVSEKLFYRIDQDLLKKIFSGYPNEEMFVTYNRGFNATHNGTWMSKPFADSVYTYMDFDFADLAYAIHPRLRYGGRLTIDWINRLHPKLAVYPWIYGIHPTHNIQKILVAKAIYKLRKWLIKYNDVSVPLSEWYIKNQKLRSFVDHQYKQSLAWSIINSELKKDTELLFMSGTVEEKLLCISYLKSVEMLFCI